MNISVVIPTFNRIELTCRALDSVFKQTRAADQVIVVDDGSTDGTHTELQQRYGSRILLLSQSNQGVSVARNTGIEAAHGDWIALLDSDDEWIPTKLAVQQQHLSQHSGAMLCHTEEIWIRNGTRVNQMNKHKKRGGDIFKHCLDLCVMSPSSVLIQTTLLKSLGGFNAMLPACEDYDLWLRICAQHPVLFISEPQLIKYGGHTDQLSRKYWGMDRFRQRALQSLLVNHCLTNEQYSQTVDVLVKKTNILMKGALKHNNQQLIGVCKKVLRDFNTDPRTSDQLPC